MNKDKYLIALTYLKEIGPVTLKKLLDYFGDSQTVWQASAADLKSINLPERMINEFIGGRQKIEPDKIIENLTRENIKVVSLFDDNYPKLLKEIYAPPLILFYQGNPELFNADYCLAVVGSRKISGYAKTVLPNILNDVIRKNVVIVSGLAYGVDQLAHQLALEGKGKTVAVIGAGLAEKNLYPPGNRCLAKRIAAEGGLLVSEFPPPFPALPSNFPRRNRIIAGLAQAALIVEAAQQSGALITAACCLEQNREVLALPQNINSPTAAGVNQLIASGAKMVARPADILESLNIFIDDNLPIKPPIDLSLLSDQQIIIYKILTATPIHIDKIIKSSNLDAPMVNSALIQMELEGLIKNIGNQNYIKL